MKKIFLMFSVLFFCFNTYALIIPKVNNFKTKHGLNDTTSLSSIFRSASIDVLKSNDSIAVNIELNNLANQLSEYVHNRYGESFEDLNPTQIVQASLLLLPLEQETVGSVEANGLTAWEIADCLVQAIGTASGIGGAVSDLIKMFNSGASVSTIFSFVKRMVRIYATWFMVAYAAWEFGHCVHWW